MDLEELMDELHRLEGTHVGVSSTAHALYVVGTLRVGVAQTRAIPEGTFVLTDELLTSLPAEPTDALKGFGVGDSATVMIIPEWFVSAQLTEHGIEIEMEHESISITTFNRDPPYAPQFIALGDDEAASRTEEHHLSTIEDRVDADLALGRHDQLVSELEKLVAAFPVRERLRGQLMLALYRTGRKIEALGAYQSSRRFFVDELGIEPGSNSINSTSGSWRTIHRSDTPILSHECEAPVRDGRSSSREAACGLGPERAAGSLPRDCSRTGVPRAPTEQRHAGHAAGGRHLPVRTD